jgi:glycerol-3-phosphate dehydrogenase
LRYLKNLEFGLVREVGQERKIVYENAPHVTRPEPLLLPLLKGGTLGVWGATIGLWLYDWLAGVKKNERRRMIRPASVMAMEPGLDAKRVIGGAWYYEYRTDDARLTLELIKKSQKLGGNAIHYANAISIKSENNFEVIFSDELYRQNYSLRAKSVVNASGPWMDEVIRLQEKTAPTRLLLSQGIHIVVDASKLPIGQAMYFDTPDRRMIFTIPREGKVYIGTTEHVSSLEKAEEVNQAHVQYLLHAVNSLFPSYSIVLSDVESVWAGVRPLILQEGKKPGEVSRKDELFEHANGMISIAGGKLTGYRKMAQRAVDAVMKRLNKHQACTTDSIALFDSDWTAEMIDKKVENFIQTSIPLGLPESTARQWAWRYGADAHQILKNWQSGFQSDQWGELKAELSYSIEHEMLVTTMDFLIRRTSWFYFDHQKAFNLSLIIHSFLAEKLSWTEQQKNNDIQNINACFSRITELKKH